jgi:fatty acid desaturase
VAIAIMKNDRAYVSAVKGSHKKWHAQYLIESRTVLVVTLMLFALDWKKALLYWMVPHLYAAWGIISMNYLQHDGCDVTHPYNHSRNFVGSFVNFFTFNNGYHGVHHDKPGLHWSLTPAEHRTRYNGKIDPRLEVRFMSLWLVATFLIPGKRKQFDGSSLVLPPDEIDQTWIPRPEETPEDLGAVAIG